jgi:phosphatidylethanolamine/phosphatidyl-N-methylethanolamine N-methyltransferase
MSHDFVSFFLSWLSNPTRIGAVAPSGNALAELITREITLSTVPVLELGPGTGVFTYKLLQKGITQGDLTLVEYGSEFAATLQIRFPGARVLWMDASKLASCGAIEPNSIGSVVSGLPLLSMPPKKVMAVLAGAFHCMRPNGAFYQFTYGPRCPVSRRILDRLGLKAIRIDRAILNVPPATVYRLTQRAPSKILLPTPQSERILFA